MTVQIIYETHSTTTDNEAGVAAGWLPGALSKQGRRQAEELGQRHRDEGIAAVFVSDLRRVVETAAIAFGGSGIPIRQDARLRECNYGALSGMPVARLVAERSRHIQEPYPGGQSYQDVVDEMRGFLRELAAGWDGRRVVVIAHSANKWALDCLLHGASLEDLVDAPFGWQEGWRYMLPAAGPARSGYHLDKTALLREADAGGSTSYTEDDLAVGGELWLNGRQSFRNNRQRRHGRGECRSRSGNKLSTSTTNVSRRN